MAQRSVSPSLKQQKISTSIYTCLSYSNDKYKNYNDELDDIEHVPVACNLTKVKTRIRLPIWAWTWSKNTRGKLAGVEWHVVYVSHLAHMQELLRSHLKPLPEAFWEGQLQMLWTGENLVLDFVLLSYEKPDLKWCVCVCTLLYEDTFIGHETRKGIIKGEKDLMASGK